ncbi:MAG: putative bifunctional diguanylate cyclase/phosphodiesterase [Gammaproteobacteria bacterium]
MNVIFYRITIATLLTLTVVGWIMVRIAGNPSEVVFFDNVHWSAGFASGAVLAWYALEERNAESPAVHGIAIGLTLLTIGQVVWDVQVLRNWLPFPGPSDLFYLATGPAIAIGLWQSASSRLQIQEKHTLLLDTLMLLVGVLTASMMLFLPQQRSYTLLQLLVMAAYPIGLILPASLAFNLLLTLRACLRWQTLLLPFSLAAFALLWVEWNLRFLADKLINGDWLNIGFSLVAILIGISASLYSLAPVNDKRWDRRCETILRFAPMLLVGLTAGAVVLANTLQGLPPYVNLVVTLGGAVTVILASIRQTYLLRERDRLLDAEEKIQRLANFDTLTNLPNRALLTDRLEQTLALSRRQMRLDAVILINIDRFKTLNDARGHEVGNALLVEISKRLGGSLREGDTLARLAADEFVLLQQDVGESRAVASRSVLLATGKVLADLRRPFQIRNEDILLTASLGITFCPEGDNDSPQEVLRRADNALHQAKNTGGGKIIFFETRMGELAEQRFRVERELHRAITAGELRIYLQSQIDACGRVVGAEALVRWQHPTRGLLLPCEFIGIAEESDLIVDLGAWVLAEACRLMSRQCQPDRHLAISVNVSPRQFREPGFTQSIKQLLTNTGANPAHLTLEITESVVIGDINDVISKMAEITALGVHFSLDDFGTGYSSLAYLKRLPIDEIKIDKTFVHDMLTDPDDAALVETIISVAKHMGLAVVAEGVETKDQADFLKKLAPLTHQGYFYGRPEPADAWISRWRDQEVSPACMPRHSIHSSGAPKTL